MQGRRAEPVVVEVDYQETWTTRDFREAIHFCLECRGPESDTERNRDDEKSSATVGEGPIGPRKTVRGHCTDVDGDEP